MKHTEVKFEDVKVGDTLYIESTGAEYAECDKRTCTVVGINNKAEILCVDFGEGFYGHNADGFVEANTGYNLWKQDQHYFTLFKVEEEETKPSEKTMKAVEQADKLIETKYTYSGKVLKHLKVGDIFFLDKFPANPSLEGKFYEVVLKYNKDNYGFDFEEVCARSVPIYIASHAGNVMTGEMVITLTRPLGKTKQDKIAKLEVKLERITNKLKALKESGE